MASAAAERRKASGPPRGPLPRLRTWRWQHRHAWRGHGWMRLSALRLPSREDNNLRLVVGKARTRRRRENVLLFHLSPPRGERESACVAEAKRGKHEEP